MVSFLTLPNFNGLNFNIPNLNGPDFKVSILSSLDFKFSILNSLDFKFSQFLRSRFLTSPSEQWLMITWLDIPHNILAGEIVSLAAQKWVHPSHGCLYTALQTRLRCWS